ncbi:nitroreductase/quinone reductase family protein [Streptomyces sp. NBC_01275]|uniref:nitroreductase/quinone reductase family protein n=1 Tax=Streptomyces sp. NBC_01275 TaxID=2903807 RepID=UPI002257BA16|nr:nitroreductase/quinone reductase family protein [Streptomyces sp. NBC_01275]MCX4763286.1 nitroreductase/quinone reductase family protein [Streptomyces sp. NBC_01275]
MSQADTARRKRPPVALFRAANRLVRPLLASRLHGVLSRFLMLLTYTGRKSGRRITIPVGYFDWEPGTVLATSSGTTWIANLRGGPTVHLRIRGREYEAVPTVIEDRTAITELLAEFADRKTPREAKTLGLPGDRTPTPEELHAAGARGRFVLFRLQT